MGTLLLCAINLLTVAWGEDALMEQSHILAPATIPLEIGMLAGNEKRGATKWITGEIEKFASVHQIYSVSMLNIDEPKRWYVAIENLPALPRNVFSISSMAGYEPMYLAIRDEIVPVDDFLPDPSFEKEDFYEALWEPVTYDGKTWGVPWCSDPRMLLCDWKMFEEEGISEPPRTWAELLEMAGRLTKDTDGDGQIDQWGFRINDVDEVDFLMITMVLQNGGSLFSGMDLDATDPVLREAIAYVQRLIDSGYAKIYPYRPMPNERFAMEFGSAWFLNYVDENPPPQYVGREQEFRIVSLPTDGKDIQLNYSTLYLSIRRSTPEQEAASWELVKWLTRRDVTLPSVWGGYPCRKDFIEREDFKAARTKSFPNLELAYELNGKLADYGPNNVQNLFWAWQVLFEQHVDIAIQRATSIDNALRMGQEKANDLLKVIPAPRPHAYALYK
jgi:ABC-type glycerol-3-phosphate transport system substrate-binding protein